MGQMDTSPGCYFRQRERQEERQERDKMGREEKKGLERDNDWVKFALAGLGLISCSQHENGVRQI